MEEWLEQIPNEDDYYDNCYNPDQEYQEALYDWCEKHPNLKNWTSYHCKIGVSIFDSEAKDDYDQILEIYSKVGDDVSLPLIHSEILYNIYPIFAYIIVTDYYGKDLAETFMGHKCECIGYSSTDVLTDMHIFDTIFPKDKIPEHIRCQIMELLTKFHNYGFVHNDIHCYNILIKDDVLKLIDFEYCTLA